MAESKRAIERNLARLDATTEEDIARHMIEDDTPEWTDEELAGAEVWEGNRYIGLVKEVQQNKGGRPAGSGTREQVTLRLDREVLAHFRAGGPGWQTRLNATLRKAIGAD